MRQIASSYRLRVTYILCAIVHCASFVTIHPALRGEDNVGRFPARTAETEPVEPADFQRKAAPEELQPMRSPRLEKPETTYALPPPTPTFSSFGNRVPFDRIAPDQRFGMGKSDGPPSNRHAMWHPFSFAELGRHTDPDDPGRHLRLGEPLIGTSWLNRPHYSALLAGSMIADDLRSNVELHNDLFLGLHQGWDFDHYYGAELRVAGGSYEVYDSPTGATADMVFFDAHLLHYPWGDARWRPYYSVGLGLAAHHARIGPDEVYDEMLIHFPLGLGVKYQWMHHCAMRFDIKHNLSFSGGGLHGMDHVSLSCGLEYRYGGRPKSYFPWSPSIHLD